MSLLPYLYLLRFQLLTAAALILLPYASLCTGASSLLRGLFDVRAPGAFFVTLAALMTAWTVMATVWLVLLYGGRRFKVRRCSISFPPKRSHVILFTVVFGFLSVPVMAGLFLQSIRDGSPPFWQLCGFTAMGVFAAVALLRGSVSLFGKFLPFRLKPSLSWLASRLGPGYTEPGGNARTPRPLLEGHFFALILFLMVAILYIGVGWGKSYRFGQVPSVPTLAYVLLLMMLLCWGLSALAFFFDRHRVPVMLPLALWWLVTSQFSQSDHYYRIIPRDTSDDLLISPSDAIRAVKRPSSVIVVAANGGGIQSAAWTAKVLTELELKCREAFPADRRIFGESIRLISSVSGGTVGAMYFVNEYDSQNGALPEDETRLKGVVRRAEASSLDDIAWGLVYPDLWRTVIPFFIPRYSDRGQALEAALTRDSKHDEANLSHGLSRWRRGVSDGLRPAVVFNATIADTGERLLMSTTDMKARRGRRNFNDLGREDDAQYKDNDISVVTAARLSSTFPFVLPAARSDLPGKQFHVVDGGYYDNYGMTTLIEWLDEALVAPDNPIRRVLVLQIRGARSEEEIELKNKRGWFYQTFAPIATMFHVRSAGQLSHSEEEFELLQRLWHNKDVSIQSALFEFHLEDPPLSWHLTPKDKAAIEEAWKQKSESEDWNKVRDFLAEARISSR